MTSIATVSSSRHRGLKGQGGSLPEPANPDRIRQEIRRCTEQLKAEETLFKYCISALEKFRKEVIHRGVEALDDPETSVIMQFIATISQERNDHKRARERLHEKIRKLTSRLTQS